MSCTAPMGSTRTTCILSPLRIRSRPTCARTPGDTASCTQGAATTSALAKARDSAPLAASTAAVLAASTAVPAALRLYQPDHGIGEVAARVPASLVPRFCHGHRTVTSPVARWHFEYRGQDWLSSTDIRGARDNVDQDVGKLGDHRTLASQRQLVIVANQCAIVAAPPERIAVPMSKHFAAPGPAHRLRHGLARASNLRGTKTVFLSGKAQASSSPSNEVGVVPTGWTACRNIFAGKMPLSTTGLGFKFAIENFDGARPCTKLRTTSCPGKRLKCQPPSHI